MSKLNVIQSFLSFLLKRKKYWLLPIVLILIFLGIILILGEGSVIAPFIYSIF